MSKERVLMAMSGGIDSSVAAMLLLEQGYELIGCTFRTFDSIRESCLTKEKGCCSVDSIMEAKHLAQQLGFEHHIVDFRQTFRDSVIRNFIDEYKAGRTPNPCVICNSHIKWGVLIDKARELGCSRIATGHYARISQHNGHYYLRRAADTQKDQTYFLWMLTEDNLRQTLFPLGDLTKSEVREIARKHGFEKLSQKRESQEICFIPDNDYRRFLASEGCNPPSGNYLSAEGHILGHHQGYTSYTIGQRKGLGIALGEPAFVTRINATTNEVTLGHHDDLYTHTVRLRAARFSGNPERPVMAQIRYRSTPSEAKIVINQTPMTANMQPSAFALYFTDPVWAVTPGQSCVIYQDDLLVGAGLIDQEDYFTS